MGRGVESRGEEASSTRASTAKAIDQRYPRQTCLKSSEMYAYAVPARYAENASQVVVAPHHTIPASNLFVL